MIDTTSRAAGGIFVPIFKKERIRLMIIKGMKHFQKVVKKKLAEWYNVHENEKIDDYKKLTNTHYTEE